MSTLRVITKTIHTAALRHNWREIRRRSRARQLLAVLKSDAYGHGLLTTAGALLPLLQEADGFAVVRMQDAIELRRHNIHQPIILLQGVLNPAGAAPLAEYRLTPVIHNRWQIELLTTLPADAALTVYVKVNSGMNRLGFEPEELAAVLNTLRQQAAVKHIVLMSHFADADTPDGLTAPLAAIAALRRQEPALPLSLGNSAATLLHGDINDDFARVGIALYGASPAPEWQSRDALNLLPAMTFATQLISIRTVAAGARIGYGGEYTAAAPLRVGIASAGYGDGYPRRKGMQVRIRDIIAPVIGRTSMEMIAVDLTNCPAASIGDKVILWGDTPAADDVAAAAGTISYQLFIDAKGEYQSDSKDLAEKPATGNAAG